MFAAEFSAPLRQGDICVVPHFPQWSLDGASTVTAPDGTTSMLVPRLSRVLRARNGDGDLVIVCSHSCDVENPRGRTGLLLAPLMPLSERHKDFDGIMASHTPADGTYSFLPLFPFELPEGENGEGIFASADLSSVITLAKLQPAIDLLSRSKRYELSDEARTLFRTKLGAFISRP